MTSILFVCLGNICRSPLAEAAMREAAARHGMAIEIDSAGTGTWHIGNAPDPRAQAVASADGVDISGYRARQVTRDDFYRFAWIVAMDRDNLEALRAIAPADAAANLSLLFDHIPGRAGEGVRDPYYGDDAGFATTWAEARAGAAALMVRIRAEAG